MENLLFAVLSLSFMTLLWIGFQFLSSHLGGWALLAREYPNSRPFIGPRWQAEACRLLRMKWEGSKSSLQAFFPALPLDIPDEVFSALTLDLEIGANAKGLYLASTRLSRPGHPALFVPWADIVINRLRRPWTEYLTQARLGFTDSRIGPETDSHFERFAFRFRKAPLVLLLVDEQNANLMASAAGDAWPGLQFVSPFQGGDELKSPC
jgi:hypothetical protein